MSKHHLVFIDFLVCDFIDFSLPVDLNSWLVAGSSFHPINFFYSYDTSLGESDLKKSMIFSVLSSGSLFVIVPPLFIFLASVYFFFIEQIFSASLKFKSSGTGDLKNSVIQFSFSSGTVWLAWLQPHPSYPD